MVDLSIVFCKRLPEDTAQYKDDATLMLPFYPFLHPLVNPPRVCSFRFFVPFEQKIGEMFQKNALWCAIWWHLVLGGVCTFFSMQQLHGPPMQYFSRTASQLATSSNTGWAEMPLMVGGHQIAMMKILCTYFRVEQIWQNHDDTLHSMDWFCWENLNRKPMGILSSNWSGLPVSIFPSSNSMIHSYWKWPFSSWIFPWIAWWFSTAKC